MISESVVFLTSAFFGSDVKGLWGRQSESSGIPLGVRTPKKVLRYLTLFWQTKPISADTFCRPSAFCWTTPLAGIEHPEWAPHRWPRNASKRKLSRYGEDHRPNKGNLIIRIVLQPPQKLRNAIDLIIVTAVGK